jgi:hypothetical protein
MTQETDRRDDLADERASWIDAYVMETGNTPAMARTLWAERFKAEAAELAALNDSIGTTN